jgi:predicted ATP-grasp superfamily ATP-dependent carboligase
LDSELHGRPGDASIAWNGSAAVLHTPPQPLRALVLDAQYCHALCAVRSLGRHGALIDVASHKPRAQSFASRYRNETLCCPNPNRERAAYMQWILETLKRRRYDATLCFEESTADILSDYRDTVRHYTGCPMPEREAFVRASRKDRASRFAQEQGLKVPLSFELQSFEELASLSQTLTFPVVVKGVSSSGSQQVAVVDDPAELGHHVRRIAALRQHDSLPLPLIQEYIPGSGYGATLLMRHGQPVASFMHRRLAEHDIASGVEFAHGASGAVSVDEPEMLQAAVRLLEALEWNGIAMVEFKRHRDTGEFYFLEINPRFVGSLELAVAAGVDLPWLYAQQAAERPVIGPTRYRVGLKYRWLISKNIANAFEQPAGYWKGVLASLLPGSRTDLSLRDPRPHLSHARNALWWVRHHLRRRSRPPRSMPTSSPTTRRASETVTADKRSA